MHVFHINIHITVYQAVTLTVNIAVSSKFFVVVVAVNASTLVPSWTISAFWALARSLVFF